MYVVTKLIRVVVDHPLFNLCSVSKIENDLKCRLAWGLVSSTNKTDRHDTTEILLKVALNTINLA